MNNAGQNKVKKNLKTFRGVHGIIVVEKGTKETKKTFRKTVGFENHHNPPVPKTGEGSFKLPEGQARLKREVIQISLGPGKAI